MTTTAIEWTDEVWNPVRGCTRVSAGCRNCYAERQAIRQAGPGGGYEGLVESTPSGPRWTGVVRPVPELLREPLSWRRPRRVFVNSMSDLFHEGLSDDEIDLVFAVMAIASRHTFQILTKRPERARDYLLERSGSAQPWKDAAREIGYSLEFDALSLVPFPLPNVWLGVSVEDQETTEQRIPIILQAPAALWWLSVEPLLGPVDLARLRAPSWMVRDGVPFIPGALEERGIGWVVVGGESGPRARPCDVDWIRQVVRQTRQARVPVFVKQLGAKPTTDHRTRLATDDWVRLSCLKSKKGGDPADWPEDLKVREYPGRSRP